MGGARWRCFGDVGSRGGRHARGVCGRVRACAGRVRGVFGAARGVRGACVGRVWGAISVGIAHSALLSGYLGKSGHLPSEKDLKNWKKLEKKREIFLRENENFFGVPSSVESATFRQNHTQILGYVLKSRTSCHSNL